MMQTSLNAASMTQHKISSLVCWVRSSGSVRAISSTAQFVANNFHSHGVWYKTKKDSSLHPKSMGMLQPSQWFRQSRNQKRLNCAPLFQTFAPSPIQDSFFGFLSFSVTGRDVLSLRSYGESFSSRKLKSTSSELGPS